MWDYEMTAFGERLGLPSLALNEEGRATLVIDDVGTLTLQKTGTQSAPELALILSRPVQSTEAATHYRRIAEAVHWKRFAERAVQAALFRDSLILTARMQESEVSAALLENVLRTLTALLDAARH